MSNFAVDVAEALTTALNGGEFSHQFVAIRVYAPNLEDPEPGALRVLVAPSAASATTMTRGKDENTVVVDVGILEKPEVLDNETLDSLMGLVQEICDFVRDLLLDTTPPARRIKTECDPIYFPEQISELRHFASVVKVTFLALR